MFPLLTFSVAEDFYAVYVLWGRYNSLPSTKSIKPPVVAIKVDTARVLFTAGISDFR